ncbi:SLC13 family permease [Desulfotignum phosphitoxidans]|uniref:Symporther protein, CitMHS family n=1 Tax=Desulfotignum phosphitoxidans DSM 13687 TaxID=1286635 RepID=S0FXZ4_9BACT|nr:SLC13 family permease [Desulfotignum phosphitoxidans]EMS78039.1 symporther protein, CitMHS family [Desulfotignum phosphitoxidans DSM 13687]
MTTDQALVFAILCATLVLFVWGKFRYDLVALTALLLVSVTGLVPINEVFLGFGHPAVITVAAVLVLSRGLFNAGAVDLLSRHMAKVGTVPTIQVTALAGIVVVCSSVMNNVGALALLMPVAIWMSRQSGRSPSLLLMPLAFGSLLGGLVTLIGTPPNIIIALYRVETGLPAFRMFDFAPVGIGVALAGLVFISLFGWRLTPKREARSSPDELFEIENYITEIIVPEGSKFVGQTIFHLTSAMEKETEATVVSLSRGEIHKPAPSWYEILEPGDVLMVEAAPDDLKALMDGLGLELAECKGDCRSTLGSKDIRLMESVITTESTLPGKTSAGLYLRRLYGVNLLAIARRGRRITQPLGQTKFMTGDILLFQGTDESLQTVVKKFKCLPLAEREIRIGQPKKVMLSVGIFGAAMVLSATGILPVQIAFTAAAVIMVLSGVVPLGEIYEHIDWPVIVLLGAMFPLGHALESSGGAGLIAEKLLMLSGFFSSAGTLAVLLAGTMLLSNVVNNAAAAVLMAPISITLAKEMGISPDPFLMAVAVGASCAFLTPVGHQSNALVMGPGGYKFGDYWRLGLPLSIIVTVVAVPLILIFWPMIPVSGG